MRPALPPSMGRRLACADLSLRGLCRTRGPTPPRKPHTVLRGSESSGNTPPPPTTPCPCMRPSILS